MRSLLDLLSIPEVWALVVDSLRVRRQRLLAVANAQLRRWRAERAFMVPAVGFTDSSDYSED